MIKSIGKNHRILAVMLAVACLVACFSFSFSFATSAATEEAAPTAAVATPSTFSWDNATVYFLLTDRFYNGNTANDHAYGRMQDKNGSAITGIDTEATFHGGDFAGITQKINEGYFTDLGVNALWISAPYEQVQGYVVGNASNPSFAHYSYHGYYVGDYTKTDESFGTPAEFKTMVDTAHAKGIRIVLDVVMNHTGYNSIYDMNKYGFGTLKTGWQDSYYSHSNVNNTTYHSFIDYNTNASDWGKWWGTDWVRAGLAGYTQDSSSDLTSNLVSLPDFRTEQTKTVSLPTFLTNKWTQEGRLTTENQKADAWFSARGKSKTVSNYLVYWLSSWVKEYGIDGFRCDTAKHVELASWKSLKTECVRALQEWKSANPSKAMDNLDFWMTGENWGQGVTKNAYYTDGGFDSMINFSFTGGGGMPSVQALESTYSSYASQINNDSSFNVLTYISSHDTALARGDLIHQGSAFLLLPGAVQIFYGDESGRGEVSGAKIIDHKIRGDMNWSSLNTAALSHWQKVGAFRNNHIAVGAGAHTKLTTGSGYGFSRTYNKNGVSDKVVCVIGATANSNCQIMVSSLWADGTVLTNAYDGAQATVTGGVATFNAGKNGTILVEMPNGMPLISLTGTDNFTGTTQVTLTLTEATSAKVSVDGGKKFIVNNNGKFTIGETAYPGDTVSIEVTASNDLGSATKTFTFKKNDPNAEPVPSVDYALVHVKVPSGVSAPNIYMWTGSNTALAGAWPGTAMSNLSDGWYTFAVTSHKTTYSVVLNGGGKQTADITGLQGEVWIELTDANFAYEMKDPTPAKSPLDDLKAAARAVKNMTSSDYTSATWSPLYALVSQADTVIAKGKSATEAEINSLVAQFTSKKSALVLANPVLNTLAAGNTTISGTAAAGATVTVTVSSTTKTAVADDVTGVWSVTCSALNSSSQIAVSATRGGINSAVANYSLTSQTTTAAPSGLKRGDANGDGSISLKDATAIQKYMASMITLTSDQLKAADANNDGSVSLKDATTIQKFLAGIIDKLDP